MIKYFARFLLLLLLHTIQWEMWTNTNNDKYPSKNLYGAPWRHWNQTFNENNCNNKKVASRLSLDVSAGLKVNMSLFIYIYALCMYVIECVSVLLKFEWMKQHYMKMKCRKCAKHFPWITHCFVYVSCTLTYFQWATLWALHSISYIFIYK